jgi:hypothetical protein
MRLVELIFTTFIHSFIWRFYKNRTYSKVNKSTRFKKSEITLNWKWAVIFAHFRFSVISFCVVALQQSKRMSYLLQIKLPCFEYKLTLFDCCNNTNIAITLNRK